jgi:hypothetical protein
MTNNNKKLLVDIDNKLKLIITIYGGKTNPPKPKK